MIRTRLTIAALTCTAMATGACATTPEAALESALQPAEHTETSLCAEGETEFFTGEIHDDLGARISLCAVPNEIKEKSLIKLYWEGEGGRTRISCIAQDCDGTIGLQRYTRPRFTELTLEFRLFGGINRLTESFSAEGGPSAEPDTGASIMTAMAREEFATAESYPVVPATEPLSMMGIEDYLPPKIWPDHALGDTAQ